MKYPTHVTVEVTTVCNIVPPCVMCGKHVDTRSGWINKDAAHFPHDLIPKIADLLAQAEVLSLYGVGEPLTCPYLFDFKQYTAPDCHIQFASNGWLLNETNTAKVIDAQIAVIDISLDATSPEKYAKIRHGNFEETIEKIARLIRERKRRNSTFPGVVLNMCLMRENIADLPALPALAKRVGANYCYAFHMNTGMAWKYDWFDYDAQHCSLDPEHHDTLIEETFRKAKEIGMPFQFKGQATYRKEFAVPPFLADLPSPKLRASPPPAVKTVCPLPWQQVIVYKDGNIANCCWMSGVFVGNLYKNSFKEIWESEVQTAVRDHLLSGKFHKICSGALLCPPQGRP